MKSVGHITYQNYHCPKSISLEDVTEYLNDLVEVSVQESQRIYQSVYQEYSGVFDRILKLKPHEMHLMQSMAMPISTANGALGGYDYDIDVKWRWIKETDKISLKSLRYHYVTSTFPKKEVDIQDIIHWDEDGNLLKMSWHERPQFRISDGQRLYPIVYRDKDSKGDTSYQVVLWNQAARPHNERFPASFILEGGHITTARYISHNKEATFWDIYELATSSNKKILLRDWLPLCD